VESNFQQATRPSDLSLYFNDVNAALGQHLDARQEVTGDWRKLYYTLYLTIVLRLKQDG
jgi:hypothetical protein